MSFAARLFTPEECEQIAADLVDAPDAPGMVERAVRHVTARMQQLYHGTPRELAETER